MRAGRESPSRWPRSSVGATTWRWPSCRYPVSGRRSSCRLRLGNMDDADIGCADRSTPRRGRTDHISPQVKPGTLGAIAEERGYGCRHRRRCPQENPHPGRGRPAGAQARPEDDRHHERGPCRGDPVGASTVRHRHRLRRRGLPIPDGAAGTRFPGRRACGGQGPAAPDEPGAVVLPRAGEIRPHRRFGGGPGSTA